MFTPAVYLYLAKDVNRNSILKFSETCLFKGVMYDHGEQTSSQNTRECFNCTCINGNTQCDRVNPEIHCPNLTCPEELQFSVQGECCKFCPGW